MGSTSAGVTGATDLVSPESNGPPMGATQSLRLFPRYRGAGRNTLSKQKRSDEGAIQGTVFPSKSLSSVILSISFQDLRSLALSPSRAGSLDPSEPHALLGSGGAVGTPDDDYGPSSTVVWTLDDTAFMVGAADLFWI